MNKFISAPVALILAAGSVFAGTTAASAASGFTGGTVLAGDSSNGTYWDFSDQNGEIGHSFPVVDGAAWGWVAHYDGTLMVDGGRLSYDGPFDITTDENLDQVITGVGMFGSLDAAVEYRVYAEGDLMRQVFVLTNNTADAITFTPSVNEDISDVWSNSATTSSGDILLTTADYWYTQFNSAYGEGATPSYTGVYSKFWGAPDHLTVVSVDPELSLTDYTSGEVVFGDITIEPGESYQWIMFHSIATYDVTGDDAARDIAAIAAGEAARAELGGASPSIDGSERLTRGLDMAINSNWFSVDVPEEAELAETGINTPAYLLSAGAMIAFAAAVRVAARRRDS